MSFKSTCFAAIQTLVPQHGLSQCVGRLAASKKPWVRDRFIQIFRHFYDINLSEAVIEDAADYDSFNDFFTRALKPGARPLPENELAVVCPADGAISESGSIAAGRLLQAKNHDYRLDELLPVQKQEWLKYVNGDFTTVYLAPKDYHRVHMPMAGRLVKTVYVPGMLYSVNQATAASIPRLFAKNERLIAFFESDQGHFCMVLVGAMIVSGIETVFQGLYRTRPGELLWNDNPRDTQGASIIFEKGDEFGRFMLGSTVILLTEPGMVSYKDLQPGQTLRCNQEIGALNS